ncbi:MAG: hypothetical protein K2H09_01910 [Treponemataceae bacterium]|nr:hypothetical protein [Treponemataceae bacterium]
MMATASGDPLELFLPYQKEWLEDRSGLKVIEKSRRCGISWTDAIDSVLDAAPTHGWSNTYYMSFNKDNCRQYIEDAGEWARKLGYAASDIIEEEALLDDPDKSITTYRIVFASGAEITGLPGVPRSLRSKQGNVVIDEAAFFDDLESVLQAAKALTIWGGRIRVISTHNGEDNPFCRLVKDIRAGKETEWSLHRITFRESVSQGLYRRICLTQKKEWSAEAEQEFVRRMYRIYRDNPDEELDVVPRASGSRYFGRGLLDLCTEDCEVPIRRLECSDDFLHRSERRKAREIERFFNQDIRPPLGILEGKVYFGADIGRYGDLSLFWFCEEVSRTSLAARLVVEVRNCPFGCQEQLSILVTDYLKALGTFGGGCYDKRGIGMQLAETMELRHPGAIVGVQETGAWYAEFIPATKSLMESGDFTVPDDDVIKADFAIVTLKNGIPTIPAVKLADRGMKGSRHGDAAAAAFLAVCAWKSCAVDPPPVFMAAEKLAEAERRFPWL